MRKQRTVTVAYPFRVGIVDKYLVTKVTNSIEPHVNDVLKELDVHFLCKHPNTTVNVVQYKRG